MEPEAASPGPSSSKSPRGPLFPPNVLLALVVASLLITGIAVIPLVVGSAWSLLGHYVCGPGPAIAREELWTPVVLVNSPYGGSANGTGKYPIPGGWWSETVGAVNGSATAALALETWNVSPSLRVLVAGPGPNAVCTGYLATGTMDGMYENTALQPNGTTSDAGQPTSIVRADPYANSYDSVRFHNGYSEQDLSVTTCGTSSIVLGTRATSISIEVPFIKDGSTLTASATIDATFNYTYSFPANVGTWSIDDLNSGADAPGGGWAFSYAPCA